MAKNTAVQRRIALLLAKAESTDSPHEADALLEAAIALMVSYNVEQAVVDAQVKDLTTNTTNSTLSRETSNDSKIAHFQRLFTGRHAPMWSRTLAWTASGYGEVRTLRSRHTNGTTVTIIGYERNARDLLTLFTSLQQQALNALKAWWRGYPDKQQLTESQQFRERRQFVESFFVRVHHKLKDRRLMATAAGRPGAEVALADRSRAIDLWIAQLHPHLRKAQNARHYAGSAAAAEAGRAAGNRASTARTKSVDTKSCKELRKQA